MSYYYRVKKKRFKKEGKEKEQYFAVGKSIRLVGLEEIAKEIGSRSIAKDSTIVPVLMELSKVMIDRLSSGYHIKLDGIGIFGISITSKGFDNPTDITPKEVKFSKITFRPDPKIVKKLKQMHYEKEPPIPHGYIPKQK
ncbi:MAG: HU family DNA-binding protein [Bacteroidales bacterium]|jgi:predicted histone-like DNA-binding protein